MLTVEIPIKDRKKPPVMQFSESCVNCGKPKEAFVPLKISMGIQKRDQMVTMDMSVPLCKACERKERKIGNVTWIPFFVSGILTGIIAFVPAWLFTPQGPTLRTLNLDLVVGAFVGLIAGLIGGTLVEFVLRYLFTPVFGQLLLKRPLTIVSLFADAEDVVGLSLRFSGGRKSLKFTFENDEIAREFAALNPMEKP